jgi:tetratricopeptide (TPR) repeat protein
MRKPFQIVALVLTSLAVWTGSSRPVTAVGAAQPDQAPPAAKSSANSADAAAEKPITAEEATKWAADLQRAVRVQDIDTFNRLVDWDAFVAKATALPGNSPQLKEFRANFARGLKSATVNPRSGFGRAVMGAVEVSGDYKALRIHNEGGQVRVLFRLVSSNGALNYHDWVLGRSANGKAVAVDCHVFLIGELYSQNLRRSFLPLAHKSGGASVEKLSGPEKDFVEHFREFAQMGQFVRERNWRQALNTYKELPASVQESKPAMTMRLLATQSVSDAEYLATIDDFRKRYPNDAMIDLISVDAYILRKAYDKALEAIDRVDKAIGRDPYLKVLRGNVLLREKKLDAARDMVQNAIVQDPNLLRGYYSLIDISLARRDYADTVKWLKKAESLGVTFGDLTAVPAFAEFVKSAEYKNWLKTHGK